MLRPNKPDKQYLSLELKRFYDAKIVPDLGKDRLMNEPDLPVTWQVQGELPGGKHE